MLSRNANTQAVNVLISAILLTVITVAIVGILWAVALPQINDLYATQRFEESKKVLQLIDAAIIEVSQVNGSVKELNVNLNDAKLDVNEFSNQVSLIVPIAASATFLPQNQTVNDGRISMLRSTTQVKMWLDFNVSGIDINNSTFTSNGLKVLQIKDVNQSNGKSLIEIKVK